MGPGRGVLCLAMPLTLLVCSTPWWPRDSLRLTWGPHACPCRNVLSFPPPRTQEDTGFRAPESPEGASNSPNCLPLLQLSILVVEGGKCHKNDLPISYLTLSSSLLMHTCMEALGLKSQGLGVFALSFFFLRRLPISCPRGKEPHSINTSHTNPPEKAGQRVCTSPRL